MSTVTTDFGAVSVDEVVRVFNIVKHRDNRAKERRAARTDDATRERNRERAKAYYEAHKDAILEKRKEYYAQKKATNETVG